MDRVGRFLNRLGRYLVAAAVAAALAVVVFAVASLSMAAFSLAVIVILTVGAAGMVFSLLGPSDDWLQLAVAALDRDKA